MMNKSAVASMMLAFCDGVTLGARSRICHVLNENPGRLLTDFAASVSALEKTLSQKALSSINAVFSRGKDYYMNLLQSKGIDYLSIYCDDYPNSLLQIANPPLVLFCIGDKAIMNGNNIAVIGSRHCGSKALRRAQTFAEAFTLGGFNVVSGLARGIDGEAQRACANAGGKTIAVLGSGIDVIYPAESKALYDDIAATGLIVSEYAPGTPPHHYQFPERNRIISALSRAVVVIEARENSGALITANIAIEQGKDVFVLPSDIDNRAGRGGNEFLKEYPTAFITCPEDVFEAMGIMSPVTENSPMALDVMEESVVSALANGPRHFDELQEILGLNSNNLNSLLAKMEINGIIIRLVGNEFSL